MDQIWRRPRVPGHRLRKALRRDKLAAAVDQAVVTFQPIYDWTRWTAERIR
jgi:hypothetical protein